MQAHNFAKAIRTDIISSLFRCRSDPLVNFLLLTARFAVPTCIRKTEEMVNHNCINPVFLCEMEKYVNSLLPSTVNVPNWNHYRQVSCKILIFWRHTGQSLSIIVTPADTPCLRICIEIFTISELLDKQQFCALFRIRPLGIGPPYTWSSPPDSGRA